MGRILVVDDERSIREFVGLVLRDAGHATELAADGDDALRVAGAFDLLLTDVAMPRMSGDELARLMRQRDQKLKVLYLTAFADRLLNAKGVLCEDEALLEKPASSEEIVAAVTTLLSSRMRHSA